MKFIEVLAAALALLLESLHRYRNRKRQEEAREILDNPDPELERRGWLRTDAEESDVPGAGKDRDTQE